MNELLKLIADNPGKFSLAAAWLFTAHTSAMPTPEETAQLTRAAWWYLYIYRMQTILANRLPRQGGGTTLQVGGQTVNVNPNPLETTKGPGNA